MAILLLLNTVAPRSCVITADDTLTGRIFEGQSFLFECYTLSILPLKLIEEFYDSASPLKEPKKERPQKQERDSTAADASLLSIAAEVIRTTGAEKIGNCFVPGVLCAGVSLVYLVTLPHRPPGEGGLAILLSLLLLILLSRRIIEEDACNGTDLPERKDRHPYVPVFFIVK